MMKTGLIACTLLIMLVGCRNSAPPDSTARQDSNVSLANQFIDAFYSFDADSLQSLLSMAIESQPGILYYQQWAACGHYEIIDRNTCIEKNDTMVICPVTVKDDLIGALHIDFYVTDTFHLTIVGGQIRAVTNSSNDPDMYYEAKAWVNQELPDLVAVPCEGIMEGGPTPCECVKAMVKGFKEYSARKL